MKGGGVQKLKLLREKVTEGNILGKMAQKASVQCYFYVIFSFSQPQMPYNKPLDSDLLDFFAYICAPILGENKQFNLIINF